MKLKLLKLARFFHIINKQEYNEKRQIEIVRKSPLFDAKWYLEQNPDVREKGIDAAKHYVKFGWKEGRNPSKKFNTSAYLILNEDVKIEGMNPLLHYIKFGLNEGRDTILPTNKTVIKKEINSKNTGVIYTCITGGYDNLIQHNYRDENWDYICFTDSETLLKKGREGQWLIKPLQYTELDNVRNARWHKTHPHCLLKEYEYSIWLDGNINVTGGLLFQNAQKCIKEHRILSVPEHPKRNCVYDEAIAIKALRKDSAEIVDKEIAELKKLNYPKNMGLNETNILFRFHNNEKCVQIMNDWFDFIQKFSRRDQLSFNYSLWKNNYQMKNFSQKRDVRYNPENFLIVKTDTHNGTFSNSSTLTTTIIVPIYNAIADVKIMLNSLEKSDLSSNVKVLLINDCSGEETSSFLREFVKGKSRYTLLENEQNLGFVKTCNRGMGEAQSDIMILLNSDTMIPKGFEKRIQDCFDSDDTIGVASPLASSSGLWDLPFKEGMTYEQMDAHIAKVSDKLYPNILCPEGFCFCVRKKVIDEVGKLDEIFGRGYCEETDLVFRILNAGYRGVLIDNLYVYHKRHASFGLSERNIQMEKNRSILWERWQSLYDKKMKKVQMGKLRRYIHDVIYYDDHKYQNRFGRDSHYKKYYLRNLANFEKMPPVCLNKNRKKTFNIFIPAINKNSLTAGPLGILYFGAFLSQSGFNVRFLLTDKKSFDIDSIREHSKLYKMAEQAEFLYIGERNEKIEISPYDICVATVWNTAYIAKFIQSKCINKRFIYMIQDYETIFYPNSSMSALVDATYDFDYNAVFSTTFMKDYFEKNKIGSFKNNNVNSIYFDTAAAPKLENKADFMNKRREKKKFVFYGRPHRARNMYELGLYIIQQAIEKDILEDDKWEFFSVGADKAEIDLANGVLMKALPYMGVDEYKEHLTEMDLGLSLMLSPHPSMVPVDLALSGVAVVTNTYANKTEKLMQNICKNILAGPPTVEGILQKLEKAVLLVDDLEQRYKNAKEATYCDKYDQMFTQTHLDWIKKLYEI